MPVYQYQSAPTPKLPPVILKVVGVPEHKVGTDADTAVADVDAVVKIIVTDTQLVVLQPPSALK